MTRYAALHRDDVPENLAMMFITFPAAKDPTYEERHPGRAMGVLLVPCVPPVLPPRGSHPLGITSSAPPQPQWW